MRTILTIDDGVLAAAKHIADRERKSVGEVLSSLVSQELKRASSPQSRSNGIPLLPGKKCDAPPVTLELIRQLRDERP